MNALDNGFPASTESVAAGYALGGLAAGAIIGSFAPAFRNRWVSGLIVAGAMTVGLLIAGPLWGEDWGVPMTILMGIFSGIVYSGLFWDYRPNNERPPTPLPNEEL